MSTLEQLNSVLNYAGDKLDYALVHIQAYTENTLRHFGIDDRNDSRLNNAIRWVKSAYKSNNCFFKAFCWAGMGYGAHLIYKKIPSVPSSVFIGGAIGYFAHNNTQNIKKEILGKWKKTQPLDLVKNIGIPALAVFGAYQALKKYEIGKTTRNSVLVALATIAALDALKVASDNYREDLPNGSSWSTSQAIFADRLDQLTSAAPSTSV